MTVILSMLVGAGIGACVAVALYLLGICVELINCACQIISCNFDSDGAIPAMWEGETFLRVALFCAIAGAVIGLIYGIYKMKMDFDQEVSRRAAEELQKERLQRINWGKEVEANSLSTSNICEKNSKEIRPLITATYMAHSQANAIINELSKVAELKGKVDAMAEDTKTKGGDVK